MIEQNTANPKPPKQEVPETFQPGAKIRRDLKGLARRTGLTRSLILRRCVEVALPMLASGEVPFFELAPKSKPQTEDAEVVA